MTKQDMGLICNLCFIAQGSIIVYDTIWILFDYLYLNMKKDVNRAQTTTTTPTISIHINSGLVNSDRFFKNLFWKKG